MPRNIRVWDVPRMVFEDMSNCYGVIKEEEISLFPDEIRIFRDIDPKKVLFKALICLQIFPKTENSEMRTIFNFWSGRDIESYKKRGVDFYYFSLEAILSINGARVASGYDDVDRIVVKFPSDYVDVQPALFCVLARTMMVTSNFVSDPMFIKKKYEWVREP